MLGIRKIKPRALLMLILTAMIQKQFWLQVQREILISLLDRLKSLLDTLSSPTHRFYLFYGGRKLLFSSLREVD